jgi:uncharacterized protein YyaL (SSP411 family)
LFTGTKEQTMPNRLANEPSPYLLQHADNPVDWYPWGEEALQKAKSEDKPIFLSIGYSACHWCHVMAHESFEDEATAAVMNERFVNVKVDREERPDLDRVYMSAVQALTGNRGWPMSVFLAPDGTPFYGGTYFPPTPRFGIPSFTDVLKAVANAWQDGRTELLVSGRQLAAAVEQQMSMVQNAEGQDLRHATLNAAVDTIARGFDWHRGGWGAGPKFPQPMTLEFLLRRHHTTGDAETLRMVTQTLDAMARGGLYDQLGGGFHRYSVDDRWLVPHFEKMLYDNAQLARVYLHAWQVTGETLYRTITEETLDYVAREMTDPAGGFYSTQDADSEGEEGKFFLWTADEIREVLGDRANPAIATYGVTEHGNFEGSNILQLVGTWEEREALQQARQQLFQVREQRIRPERDDKVITAWNGLMLAAFAEAARVLERDDYRAVAESNAAFLLRELRKADGRLYRTWKDGVAKGNGYLADYTHLIDGLLELYQCTFDSQWYAAARDLADTMITHFAAVDAAGFYDTSDDHETLITRPRELQDNATPSGNGMATLALQRLAGLSVEPRYAEAARQNLISTQSLLGRYPLSFGQWLAALDYALARPREIAIAGGRDADDTQALLRAATAGYRPHQIVALGDSNGIPLLQSREPIDGRAAAYVCVDATCRPPVTEPAALSAELDQVRTGHMSVLGRAPG